MQPGVITTCPPTPARPPSSNMLALVVEEDTRATTRVKMKFGPSNHINHYCDRIAERDPEIRARCSGGNDSPARWLENGAIFKPIQAILTEERQEPWNEEGRVISSFVQTAESTACLDSEMGARCSGENDSPVCWLKNGAFSSQSK